MEQMHERTKETRGPSNVPAPVRKDLAASGPWRAPEQVLLSLQSKVGNDAVSSLVRARRAMPLGGDSGLPVIQRLSNFHQFNVVLNGIAGELDGSSLARILKGISNKSKLDPDDDEQNIAFRSAWKGDPKAEADEDTDRIMKESLIQSDWYGIGAALQSKRLQNDKGAHLSPESPDAGSEVFTAFQNAMFFRAKRRDSQGQAKGRLEYNPDKHGPKGSAATMPGRRGEGVRKRSENNLFLTRNRKELVDYIEKAVGGEREILNVVASREDVAAMQYDVDSFGYKTTRPLTGIVSDRMTPAAKANLNTWMKGNGVDDDVALNRVLNQFLRSK